MTSTLKINNQEKSVFFLNNIPAFLQFLPRIFSSSMPRQLPSFQVAIMFLKESPQPVVSATLLYKNKPLC